MLIRTDEIGEKNGFNMHVMVWFGMVWYELMRFD